MPQEWQELLRQARATLRLSRHAVAELSGVSEHTIKAYELGTRHPSRPLLLALLDTLGADRTIRTRILEDAGFATDAEELRPARDGYWYSLEEATEAIAKRRWPAHIFSEMMEVLAANDLMLRVWGVAADEVDAEHPPNILASASNPQFADRLLNWDEVMSTAIAVMKGHHRGPQAQAEGSTPYFSSVMARFMAGDPKYVARAFHLFETVPPRYPKIRQSYNVTWNHPDVGVLRFEVLITTANDLEGFTFQDYIPLDAETWERLERLRST